MRASLIFFALWWLGCSDGVVVELESGAQTFELNASAIGVPAALRDGASGSIASIDCSATGICPSTAELPIACAAGVCDPEPLEVAIPVGDVLDFEALLAEASPLLRVVDAIEIARADYAVSPNGLTFELPATELLWAPASAVSAAEATRLGTLPSIPAATPTSGLMAIDAAGAAALSDHILGSDGRVRFFARTVVDITPGSPFPEGIASASVNLRLRAIGRFLD